MNSIQAELVLSLSEIFCSKELVMSNELLLFFFFSNDQPCNFFSSRNPNGIIFFFSHFQRKFPTQGVDKMEHCYDQSPLSCSPVSSAPKWDPLSSPGAVYFFSCDQKSLSEWGLSEPGNSQDSCTQRISEQWYSWLLEAPPFTKASEVGISLPSRGIFHLVQALCVCVHSRVHILYQGHKKCCSPRFSKVWMLGL